MTDTAFEPEVTEAQDTETVAEVTEESPEDQAAKAAQDLADAEASLELFQLAAVTAIEEADTTTGTLPEAALEPVKSTYRNIVGGAKFKNKGKAFVAESMREVLGAGDLAQMYKAVAWNTIVDAIAQAPAKTPSESKPAVSPNKVYADKAQTLRLALDLFEGAALPEGVTEDWEDERDEADSLAVAEEYMAWLSDPREAEEKASDEPEVSAVVKSAVKLALSKGPRKSGSKGTGHVHTGPKRDVGVHIENAFAQAEVGQFLTVSEIKNTPSEEYGTDSPSAGAINQRLRPPSGKPTTIAGIVVEKNADDVWGARKI